MDLMVQINIKEITRIYLLANTPMFLYRNMKGLYSLKNLIRNNDLPILIDEYDKRTTKKDKQAEDMAISYAILVAITFLDYQVAIEALKNIDVSRLEWGDDIKDIFVSRAHVYTNVELSMKPKISTDELKSDSAANFSYLNAKSKE